MKKMNWMKRLSVGLVAMALVLGIAMPVNAAKKDLDEVSKEVRVVGAAPKVTLQNKKMYGQHITGWTFSIPSVLPQGSWIALNLYKDDANDSYSGEWNEMTYDASQAYQSGTKKWFQADSDEFKIDRTETSTFVSKNYAPGTYKVNAYYYDVVAYKNAVNAKMNELKKTYSDVQLRTAWWESEFNPECEYHNFVIGEYWSNPIATVYMADYIVSAGTFTLKMDIDEPGVSSSVKATSVQLELSKHYGTGYEIYRKVGSSYKKIATTTKNTYTDKNLTSKTKYNYKVRVYYKDKKTGKISYGPYTAYECATKGSALNLKLTVQKTKNVKLSWTKISGAKQYKVYRRVASSNTTTYSKGGAVSDSYGKWELIKTLSKSKKTYTDKKTAANCSYQYMVVAILPKDSGGGETQIDDSKGVSFYFGDMNITANYEDVVGNRTVEWNKSYGAKGYIVEKKVIDATNNSVSWKQVTKLGASATKYKFVAKKLSDIKPDAEGKYDLTETYRIYPYKDNGATIGQSYEFTTTATLGMVKNVKAKKVSNGIQVTWSPVTGAAYYEVYRIPASFHALNKDIKGYVVGNYHVDEYDNTYDVYPMGGKKVVEYVGAQKPVAVNVATWNAAIDAFNKDTTGTVARPVFHNTSDKLDQTKTYYYQNYQYQRSQFTTTSIVDYAGEIYTASMEYCGYWDQASGQQIDKTAARPVEVKSSVDYYLGAEPGITYQYYVIAYAGREQTWQDYKYEWNTEEDAKNNYNNEKKIWVATPSTLNVQQSEQKLWKYHTSSYTCSSFGEANYSAVAAPSGKPTIKSITSSKKTVTIKLKKKVKGAVAYRVYRATKKKGKYTCVGITTSTTFKDAGLKVGKTYYYKVTPIATSEAGEDIAGKTSGVKSVKVKK